MTALETFTTASKRPLTTGRRRPDTTEIAVFVSRLPRFLESFHAGVIHGSPIGPGQSFMAGRRRPIAALSDLPCSRSGVRLPLSQRRAGAPSIDILDTRTAVDFRHRVAKLGAIELNALQFGGDVMVAAPHLPDFYLLHFMLAGACTLTQGGRWFDEPSGSVAVINPNRPFAKKLSSAGRQLLVRIERRLLDRELQAWTGREPKELIEFDQSGAFAVEKVQTLTHAVRMLCDDLRDESSSLDHPLVRRRIASTLASALLVGLPHNYSRAFEAGNLRSLPLLCAAPSGSSRRTR
jgi:AraC-binding-like domain